MISDLDTNNSLYVCEGHVIKSDLNLGGNPGNLFLLNLSSGLF